MKKIVATVLAAIIAASAFIVPASAASSDEKKQVTGLGIFPILAGPVGAAALFPTTSTLHWATTKTLYYKFSFYTWKWYEVPYCHGYGCHKKYVKVKHQSKSSSVGKAVVGCIMGSALGAITAAIRKGNALGNPLRWRSQAEHEMIVKSGVEKKFELTNEEAQTALAFCGLGSFALHWQQTAPVVRAGY
jgi:hypothetical protein